VTSSINRNDVSIREMCQIGGGVIWKRQIPS